MRKIILIVLILAVACGTGFARGGHGGGGHGGGGHGGAGHGGDGRHWSGGGGHHSGYHRRGAGYDRGWGGRSWCGGWRYGPGWGGGYWGCSNIGFGVSFGSGYTRVIDNYYISQPAIVQTVTPIVQPAYIDIEASGAKYVVTCPKCNQPVDCSGIPRGAHASCPYCKRIMY